MLTCSPVMVLTEDIETIDAVILKRYNGDVNIFSRERRKDLIGERKSVIHQIISEWEVGQEKS